MSHASFVPVRAEPRNRTLLRGVRRSLRGSANCVLPLPNREADDPHEDRQCEASDQGRPRHLIAQRRVEAVARVPNDMTNPPDKVMEKRPSDNETGRLARSNDPIKSENIAKVEASAEAAMRNQARVPARQNRGRRR